MMGHAEKDINLTQGKGTRVKMLLKNLLLVQVQWVTVHSDMSTFDYLYHDHC